MESERRKYFKNRIKHGAQGNERNLRSKKVTEFCPENNSEMGVTVLGSSSYFNQNKDKLTLFRSSGKENNPETSLDKQQPNHQQQEMENNCSRTQVSSTDDFFKEKQNDTVDDHVSKQTSVEKSTTCENFQHDNSNFIEFPDNETVLERSDDSDSSIQFTHETITVQIEVEKINNSKESSTLENNSETDITRPIENKQTIEELSSNDMSDINQNEIRQEKSVTPVNYSFTDQSRRENDESPTNHLSPTFKEIIPENEMDLIRKSLENENAEMDIDDDILNIPENQSQTGKPRSRKRRKTQIKKTYVDFLSEDEDFVWDSTSWKDTDDPSSDEEPAKKKKRKKRTQEGIVGDDGLKKKKVNKRAQQKAARTSGQEYVKRDGSISKAKQMQGNPCIGKPCGHKCGEISDEKRQGIFDHFWSLNIERRRDWIVAMSTKREVKRKRTKDSNYRTNTFDYYINDGEGRRQVCLQFLLNTLDVNQRFVYYTVSNATSGSAKTESRGKTAPKNKTPEQVRNSAINFIKTLPALPSHLCRKDSTRLYLSTELKNLKNLYRIYKEELTSAGVDVINEKIFRNIFNDEFNLGFHVPKKDKCVKCLKYEGKDKTTPEIITHLEEKQAAKDRLEFQRELPKKNPAIMCTSFDLQKVLNTPYGNSMLLYYSRKYAVFNLCFYESVTRNGFCYVWGETEGKRGGVEIASILQKYVENVDQRKTIKHLILYSDSCAGQNKNKIVLAALHNALQNSKNLETIQMNYLLPGHTEMTVDSIHSTIESSIRNTMVWAPSQWLTICQLARKDPKPYYVQALMHDDFKNYDDFSEKYFKGNLVGKISKVRIATFKKTTPNVMTVKFTMKDDAKEETILVISKGKSLTSKYIASLPITKTKYKDLKKLCDTGVIPRVFHQEYLQFSTYNGQDVLLDTDVEDEVDNVE